MNLLNKIVYDKPFLKVESEIFSKLNRHIILPISKHSGMIYRINNKIQREIENDKIRSSQLSLVDLKMTIRKYPDGKRYISDVIEVMLKYITDNEQAVKFLEKLSYDSDFVAPEAQVKCWFEFREILMDFCLNKPYTDKLMKIFSGEDNE